MVETVKNQGYIIKDLAKELKSKVNMKELNPLLNLKANNSDVFKAINNLCNSIGNLPTISQFSDLNEEKVSKSEIIYYLKAKPSFEDIENLLDEKINKSEFNNKYEELNQNLEKFKKEMLEKIDELVDKKEIKVIENKEKEILNILDKKADKEYVFNSLKLKSDKDEINTIFDNKLDKADLANILKLIEDKLNKEEFINYKKNQEIEINQKNNNLDDTYLNIVKEISKRVQEMKKDINMRFEIVNTDIEKLSENLKSKYDSISIMINNINKNKMDSEDYINSLKKKMDIEKFDSLIKKIKSNLEYNFLEITKNNSKIIEGIIENKINDINSLLSEDLNNQNSRVNSYISENKNKWAEYQIDVQSMISKINSENKLELKKLRNEFLENMEVKITEKFYELTEETKNKNNQNSIINHNSSLNSIDNEINPKINKNLKNESQIKEKCEINEMNIKLNEIKNEIENNRSEFSKTLDNQALINETLCEENKLGKWSWTMSKLKNNNRIIWDIQEINTFPDNYILENEKSVLLIKQKGIYEIIFGFYGYNKKPNIQILVNNDVIISNSNKNNKTLYENGNSVLKTTNSEFFKGNRNMAINGGFRNATGITFIDYINIENNSKLSVFYNGDNGKGFFCIKKIINFK